ncbi:MAG TPA: META domain-containing protein [Sphingomicrobium sp.]|nr:META domain-containing protein [Sphingomicrobium sp.]
MFRLLTLSCAATLSACVAPPPAAPPGVDLRGTDWHIVAVNGHQTPAQGDYSMHFGADYSFGAKFGCNSMGGNYTQAGSTLTVTNLRSTLIGCPEPSATFESKGSAILGQPMAVSFTSNDRMSLSNAAGTITLDQVT